jgi:hypothetical protein
MQRLQRTPTYPSCDCSSLFLVQLLSLVDIIDFVGVAFGPLRMACHTRVARTIADLELISTSRRCLSLYGGVDCVQVLSPLATGSLGARGLSGRGQLSRGPGARQGGGYHSLSSLMTEGLHHSNNHSSLHFSSITINTVYSTRTIVKVQCTIFLLPVIYIIHI